MAGRGDQLDICRRAGDLHLRAGRDIHRLGDPQDFRGANNYRPNVTCDPLASGDSRTDQQLVQSRLRRHPHGREPAVRQRGTQLRPRPEVLAVRFRSVEELRAGRTGTVRVPLRGVQSAQSHQPPRAERQPQPGAFRHDHDDLRSAAAATRVQAAVVSRGLMPLLLLALAAPASTLPPAPIVIGHRGASGHRPEHTLEGYTAGRRDGRRLHRAGPRLDEGRRADRAARERDRRHHRRRRSSFPIASAPRPSTASRSPAGSPRTSRSPRSRRCARASASPFRSHAYDGKFQIPTFDEVIELAQKLGTRARPSGRRLPRNQAPDLLPRDRPAAGGAAAGIAREARLEPEGVAGFHPVVRAGQPAGATREDDGPSDSARQQRGSGHR